MNGQQGKQAAPLGGWPEYLKYLAVPGKDPEYRDQQAVVLTDAFAWSDQPLQLAPWPQP
jgi:hypothetical protein